MENQIAKIIIEYENGESKTVEKGVVMEIKAVDNKIENVSFNMCNIAGKDLYSIVAATIQLGERIGLFKDTKG